MASVVKNTYPEIRYDRTKNPILEEMDNYHPSLVNLWREPVSQISVSPQGKQLTTCDTDDVQDVLYMGTEVENSCQSLSRSVQLSQGLIGTLL